MGHAGAIVGGADDTAEAKKRIMRENGIHVVDSPAEIGKKVKRDFRIIFLINHNSKLHRF